MNSWTITAPGCGSLDGLEETEARTRLVSSRTTLLGLVKHVTFVERFWFGHILEGWALKDPGVASTRVEHSG